MNKCALCKLVLKSSELNRIKYISSVEMVSGNMEDGDTWKGQVVDVCLEVGDIMPKAEVTREITLCSDCFHSYTKSFLSSAKTIISAMTSMWIRK